jgi:Mitochondrial carrier protein
MLELHPVALHPTPPFRFYPSACLFTHTDSLTHVHSIPLSFTSSPLFYVKDTIKKRLQVQVLRPTLEGVQHLPKYKGFVHCITRTFAEEGVQGFYRGIVPTVAKSVLATAVTFAAFDVSFVIAYTLYCQQQYLYLWNSSCIARAHTVPYCIPLL